MADPVFVELRTDAFAENFSRFGFKPANGGARRPLRGFEIKEDTYAVIKVIKSDGTMIPLTDAAGPISQTSGGSTQAASGIADNGATSPRTGATYNYSNFIIQSVVENRQEKAQLLETFGDSFVFFFGERPRVLQVSGVLMNTLDFNWRSEFWYNYENTLRGTKLVEQNARIYLFYDDLVVEGYMMGANATDDANNPYHIAFNFQLFVTNHQYLGNVGQENYPITHGVNLAPLLTSAQVKDAKAILSTLGIQVQNSNTLVGSLTSMFGSSGGGGDSFGSGTTGTFGGKNTLLEGINLGIQSSATLFLDVAKNFFNAGMSMPSRTLPYRTKLRDNWDERVNNYEWGAVSDDRVKKAILDQQFKSMLDAGGAIVGGLIAAGVAIYDVTKNGCELLEGTHTLVASSSEEPVYSTFAIKTRGYGA